jgi:membrane protease YdiL (CAAX protease family)
MWIAFHLPWILNKPDQYGVPWALAVLGMSLTMTWLWLRTGGSLAMAVVFHAVVNASIAAAIQLFPEADRPLAWGIAATLWLATGVATASRLVSPPGHPRSARRRVSTMVARHPLAWFFALAFGIAWSALVPAVALGLPVEPFHLAANFGGLLGSAVLVTAVVGGRSGVRDLFQRVFQWRFRWPPVTAAALVLPIATGVMAAVAGSLRWPVGGWPEMVTAYLVATVTGLLLFNLWEETAWAGFVQRRLTDRHGVLRGALLTSVPFAAIHLPLVFVDRPTSVEVAINVAALMVVAVAFRFLAGVVLAGARGSVLAVALVHASFNASGGLPGVTGGWESVVGLAVVTAFASSLWLRGQARVPK